MIKIIFMILGGIGIGLLFSYLKGKILNKVKDTAFEQFDSKKLRAGLFRVRDKVSWCKSFVEDFNIRTVSIRLGIILLIAGIIFSVGEYQGRMGKPIQVNLNYEKEFKIKVNGNYLLKPKNSKQLFIVDKKGNKIKDVTVGDVDELQKKLRPFGFIIEPYFSTGFALTDKGIKQDTGVGVNWLKYYKWRVGNWLSNNGIWIGVSYKLTENWSIGGGTGRGWNGGNLVNGGFQFKF